MGTYQWKERLMPPTIVLTVVIALLGFSSVPARAHPHEVTTGHGGKVEIANGQNHPGFVEDPETGLFMSCQGLASLPNEGPAGYGLETAHHGPDAGRPGKADGCFATQGPPSDTNPAID